MAAMYITGHQALCDPPWLSFSHLPNPFYDVFLQVLPLSAYSCSHLPTYSVKWGPRLQRTKRPQHSLMKQQLEVTNPRPQTISTPLMAHSCTGNGCMLLELSPIGYRHQLTRLRPHSSSRYQIPQEISVQDVLQTNVSILDHWQPLNLFPLSIAGSGARRHPRLVSLWRPLFSYPTLGGSFDARANSTSFLPRVTDIQKDPELADKLAEVFHIDSYFLSQGAYESNGFFHIEKTAIDGFEGTCISKDCP